MLESILIGIIAVIGLCDYCTGTSMIQRPVVLGPLVGLVLGDLTQGVIIGSSIELAFMGVMYIGGAMPVNALGGGLIATAVAIKTGAGVEAALAIAMPIGALFAMLDNVYYIIAQFIVQRMDNACEEGNPKRLSRLHYGAFGIWALLYFVTATVTVHFGSSVIGDLYNKLPEVVLTGIAAGTKLLPALGFALLLRSIWNRRISAFFFIGFVLAAYLGMPTVGISILGISVAVLYFMLHGDQKLDFTSSTTRTPLLSNRELKSIFLRSFTLEASYTYERFQGTGFCYSMLPALEKYYGNDKRALAAAMTRNIGMFQTTPHVSPIVMGVTCAMEEQYSQDPENMDPASISAVRSALMGPFAGVGDSIFWGILRTVAAGIACSIGVNGNALAPIVFMLVFNVPHVLVRWIGLKKAYELGVSFVSRLSENNLLEKLSLCAGMVGLMVIGGMTSSMVYVETPLTFTVGGMDVVLQETLDSILPSMLSLLTVFIMYKLLKKKVKPIVLMLGTLVLGVLLTLIGVL